MAPVNGSTDFWGTTASQMQDDIAVTGDKITGTLTKLTEGQLVNDWGEGYFLALKWSDLASGITSLKVGLTWSDGSGLIECLDDMDRNGVFKIADKDTQKFTIVQTTASGKKTDYYDLSGLVLE